MTYDELDALEQEEQAMQDLMQTMKPENREKLKVLMAYEKVYPSGKMSVEKRIMYLTLLTDILPEELTLAMQKLVRTQTFYPAVAEIVQAVESIRDTVNPEEHVPTAEEAWFEVMSEVRKCYPYAKPCFSTAEIAQTVHYIGWTVLAETPASSLSIVRAHFRDTYNNMLKRKKGEEENIALLLAMPKEMAVRIAHHKKINNRQMLTQLLLSESAETLGG